MSRIFALLIAMAACSDGAAPSTLSEDFAVPDAATDAATGGTDGGQCQPEGAACTKMQDCCQQTCQTCDANRHVCIRGCA